MTASEQRLALEGGPPALDAPLPIEPPPPAAEDAQPLETFERELAAWVGGGRIAIACDGRARGLEWCLRLALLERGITRAEVALPALGADDAARAVIASELLPLPVEVDEDSANLSARALAEAVRPQTDAIVVAHTFGHPAAMADLVRVAQRNELALIEDASHGLGGEYAGAAVGSLGSLAALGGAPGRLLSAADLGAVLVSDERAAQRLREWRDELSAAPSEQALRVGITELRRAEEVLHARRQLAWHLTYELRGLRGVASMHHGRRVRHAYDRYTLRLRSVLWARSPEETVAALQAEGVPASLAAGVPLHEDTDVRGAFEPDDPRLDASRFTVAERLARELIAIPLDPAMTTRHMDGIAEAIRKVARASEREAAAGV